MEITTIIPAIYNGMLSIKIRLKAISRMNGNLYYLSIYYGPNAPKNFKEKP